MENDYLKIYGLSALAIIGTMTIKYISTPKEKYKIQTKLSEMHHKPNLWGLSHLLLYITIGLVAPGHLILIIFNSIGWEIFETQIPFLIPNLWDIPTNIFGYIIGSYLGTYII